jgi:tetratricopeptide (TPR) repeat protein
MYAFSLEEYGNYAKAKKHAKLALSLDPKDCWATHALAHCYEMCGEYEVGLKFMQENEEDWKVQSCRLQDKVFHKKLPFNY